MINKKLKKKIKYSLNSLIILISIYACSWQSNNFVAVNSKLQLVDIPELKVTCSTQICESEDKAERFLSAIIFNSEDQVVAKGSWMVVSLGDHGSINTLISSYFDEDFNYIEKISEGDYKVKLIIEKGSSNFEVEEKEPFFVIHKHIGPDNRLPIEIRI